MNRYVERINTALFNKASSDRRQIDSLDGLRGLAVTLVILSHFSQFKFRFAPWLDFSGAGKYGVFLFFVLSSFLLTMPMWRRGRESLWQRPLWLTYFARRFLRIYPMYLVALTLGAVSYNIFGFAIYSRLDWGDALEHVFLLEGKNILWAIPVEFKFYLVLPAVVFAFRFLFRDSMALAGAVTLVAGLALHFFGPHDYGDSISLVPYLPAFFFGGLASLAHVKISGMRPPGKALKIVLEIAAALILAGIIATIPSFFGGLAGGEVKMDRFHEQVVFYGAAWSAFIVLFLTADGLFDRVLRTRAMRFVGIVSFSAYLLHWPAVLVASKIWEKGGALHCAGLILATLLISGATFLVVERPFIRLGATGLPARYFAASKSGKQD